MKPSSSPAADSQLVRRQQRAVWVMTRHAPLGGQESWREEPGRWQGGDEGNSKSQDAPAQHRACESAMRAPAQPVRLTPGRAAERGRVGASRSPSPSSPGLRNTGPSRVSSSRRQNVTVAASTRGPSPGPAGPNGDISFIAQKRTRGKPVQSLAQQFTAPSEGENVPAAPPVAQGVIVSANQIQLTVLVLVVFLGAAASSAVLPLCAPLRSLPFPDGYAPFPVSQPNFQHLACAGYRTSQPALGCRTRPPH